MGDAVLGLLISLFILSALDIVDVTFEVSPHVKGEKVVCVRGKSEPAEANGQ